MTRFLFHLADGLHWLANSVAEQIHGLAARVDDAAYWTLQFRPLKRGLK